MTWNLSPAEEASPPTESDHHPAMPSVVVNHLITSAGGHEASTLAWIA
jgi:hypothetical protein